LSSFRGPPPPVFIFVARPPPPPHVAASCAPLYAHPFPFSPVSCSAAPVAGPRLVGASLCLLTPPTVPCLSCCCFLVPSQPPLPRPRTAAPMSRAPLPHRSTWCCMRTCCDSFSHSQTHRTGASVAGFAGEVGLQFDHLEGAVFSTAHGNYMCVPFVVYVRLCLRVYVHVSGCGVHVRLCM
jgi:hypothetical protein